MNEEHLKRRGAICVRYGHLAGGTGREAVEEDGAGPFTEPIGMHVAQHFLVLGLGFVLTGGHMVME